LRKTEAEQGKSVCVLECRERDSGAEKREKVLTGALLIGRWLLKRGG